MEKAVEEFSLGILRSFMPILACLIVIVLVAMLLFLVIRLAHGWIKRLGQKGRGIDKRLIRQQRNTELRQQEEERRKELLAKYRKAEGLSEDASLYEIYDTGLYSPYEVDLTDAEYDLVKYLKTYFKQSCILVDNYFCNTPSKMIQIDCIAVDEHGVFVFESKDYSGWIFGNGNQPKWTQVLAHGREKYRFYNPVKQNAGHVSKIKNVVGTKVPIYSIVVFSDNCVLKDISYIPTSCRVCRLSRLGEVLDDISLGKELISLDEIARICKELRQNRLLVTPEVRNKHVSKIQDTLGAARVYK